MDRTASHPASEVLEKFAEGDMKGIFADMTSTFRAPVVSDVFRVLATRPNYLRVAWRQLQTNAQTVYFEARADEIRSFAVTVMSEIGEVRTPTEDEQLVETLRVFHYLYPKVLLAVSALRAATLGQFPRLSMLPSDEKRQIAPGPPASMASPSIPEPDSAEPAVRTLFDEVKSTFGVPVVSDDLAILGTWPEFLQGSWAAVRPRLTTPEYRRAVAELRRLADRAVLAFPFRMDVTPHTLRHAGMHETDIDWVRSTLDLYYRVVPQVTANLAVTMTGLEGRSASMQNPFPPALLD